MKDFDSIWRTQDEDGSWPELFDELYVEYSSGRMFGTLNFTEYCEFSVRSDEKYHAVLEETQRIHSVAWYISMITDEDYMAKSCKFASEKVAKSCQTASKNIAKNCNVSDSLSHISLDFFDYDRIISLDFFNSYQIICLDYFFFVSLRQN